jgi:hypothetical protein
MLVRDSRTSSANGAIIGHARAPLLSTPWTIDDLTDLKGGERHKGKGQA